MQIQGKLWLTQLQREYLKAGYEIRINKESIGSLSLYNARWKWAAVKLKVNGNTNISSIKRVTKTFLEVSRCSRAKQLQRNVQKKVCCTCKVAFLLIRPIVVFHRSPALPSSLSITLFYIFVWTNYKYYWELRF